MPGWLYVALCVAAPAAWAVVMFFVFGWWDRRRRRGGAGRELPPVDYSI